MPGLMNGHGHDAKKQTLKKGKEPCQRVHFTSAQSPV
jgi:hypothetical protein